MGNFGTQIAKSAGWLGGAAPAAAAAVPKGIGGLGGAAGGVAAGLGHGAHVAGLSVPNSWPGSTLASAAKPVTAIPVSEPITAGESGAGNLIGGMPVGGMGAGAEPPPAHATDSNPPSWPAPCPRLAADTAPEPGNRPTHPKAGRGTAADETKSEARFFPPRDNSSAKHLVSPLLSGRGDPLLPHRAFRLVDRTTIPGQALLLCRY